MGSGDLPKILELVRLSTSMLGTVGVFLDDGIPLCLSLEEPWLNNERSISCIPEGAYDCTWERHPQFSHAKRIARLSKVPDRSGILIHPGNTLDDIEGCIIPGKDFSIRNSKLFLEFSTYSLDKIRIAVDDKPFILNIIWAGSDK